MADLSSLKLVWGHLETILAHVRRCLDLPGRSRGLFGNIFGASWPISRPSWENLGAMLEHLGLSWDIPRSLGVPRGSFWLPGQLPWPFLAKTPKRTLKKHHCHDLSVPILVPKLGPHFFQNWSKHLANFGPVLSAFELLLAPILGSETPRNEPRWLPKAAQESQDSEEINLLSHVLRVVFYNEFGAPGLPKKPQETPGASRNAPRELQEAIQKGVQFWNPFSANNCRKMTQESCPEVIQISQNKILKTCIQTSLNKT